MRSVTRELLRRDNTNFDERFDQLQESNLWKKLRLPDPFPDWRVIDIFSDYRKLVKVNKILSDPFNEPPFINLQWMIEEFLPAMVAAREDAAESDRLEKLILSDEEDDIVLKELLSLAGEEL